MFEGVPLLVIASRQTAGRGRGGAEWENAPRAMAASLALKPEWPSGKMGLMALIAGIAASRVVGCGLKWPNDLVKGSKVGGVLSEASAGMVVIGCGLNLWWPDAPAGYGAIYDQEPGGDLHVALARSWCEETMRLLSAGPESWPHDEYRSRCTTIGRDIVWEPGGEGRAVDVDVEGALVVRTPDGEIRLRSGEIRHVRH